MQVDISEQFLLGTANTPYFIDFPLLDNDTKRLIADFVADVTEGKALEGINKESWLNDNRDEIETAKAYQENCCWHYHVGPHLGRAKSFQTALKLNMNGSASSAILHYQKISDEHILILAYSPKHIPFPRFNHPSNPIFERIKP